MNKEKVDKDFHKDLIEIDCLRHIPVNQHYSNNEK